MTRRILGLLLALVVCPGTMCEPGTENIKETFPAVRIKAVKSPLGAAADIALTSNFKGRADGSWNKATGDFEFKVAVDSDVAGVLPEYTNWGERVMLPSQKLSNEWHHDLRVSILEGMRIIAPLVGQYIGAWQSLGEKELMRPSLISQAAGVLAMANAGGGDFPFKASAIWSTFGPELRAALQRLVPSAVPGGVTPIPSSTEAVGGAGVVQPAPPP